MNRRAASAASVLLAIVTLGGCVFLADALAPRTSFAGVLPGASFTQVTEAELAAHGAIVSEADTVSLELDAFIASPDVKVPMVRAAVVADSHAVRIAGVSAPVDTVKAKRIRAEADTVRRVLNDSIVKRPAYNKLPLYAKRTIDNALKRAARIDSIAATLAVIPTPPPPPPDTQPQPPPPPPPVDPGAVCGKLIAWPLPTVSQTKALGGFWADYETKIATKLDSQWELYGPNWETMNYYDRAAIYYVWWCRTGRDEYRTRARAMALDYRTKMLEGTAMPYTYNVQAHWYMPLGLALHWLDTGDRKSLEAVSYAAEWVGAAHWMPELTKRVTMALPSTARTQSPAGATLPDPIVVGTAENRVRSRILFGFVLSHALNAPHDGPATGFGRGGAVGAVPGTWAEKSKFVLDAILSMQYPDGSYRDETSGGAEKPFMDGLLNDALILYYQLVSPDPRILGAIKRNLDYNWANTWLGTSFAYYEWQYCSPVDANWCGGRYQAADLNLMMVNGFAWVYAQTRDVTYRDRGREIFKAGVELAYMDSGKHLNQQGTSSFRALPWIQ